MEKLKLQKVLKAILLAMLLLPLLLIRANGNSATATKLQSARNIKLQGAISGNANFDGSQNITITTTQTNIAILTGTVNGNGIELNYPTGFTKDNCVCISVMFQNPNSGNGSWSVANGGLFQSSSYITGAMPCKVVLSTKISIQTRIMAVSDGSDSTVVANSTTGNFNFKVILMRIP